MNAEAWIGFLVAGLMVLGAMILFGADGQAVLFVLSTVMVLAYAASADFQRWVRERLSTMFDGSRLRVVLILIGALLIWQFIGMEMALLMAGDVLAYLEVVAAVGLMAANTRFVAFKAAVHRRFAAFATMFRARVSGFARSVRAPRLPRRGRPAPTDDDPAPVGWAMA